MNVAAVIKGEKSAGDALADTVIDTGRGATTSYVIFGAMSYGFTVGQAAIPIPVIGGIIGSLVGSVLTSGLISRSTESLRRSEIEHQERMRLIAECEKAKSQEREFRAELESYLREWLHDIPNKNFPGMDELRNFKITPSDMIQLREMGSLYDGALAAGVGAGTAAGFAALAANGSLTTVGSALTAGNISTALTGISSLAASPLAVVAAPVMFFTALSVSMKADENKEKARAMLADAEAKAEKMKTDETFCRAVGERAEMFRGLLETLDMMFAPCVQRLENMVQRKAGYDSERMQQSTGINRQLQKSVLTFNINKSS